MRPCLWEAPSCTHWLNVAGRIAAELPRTVVRRSKWIRSMLSTQVCVVKRKSCGIQVSPQLSSSMRHLCEKTRPPRSNCFFKTIPESKHYGRVMPQEHTGLLGCTVVGFLGDITGSRCPPTWDGWQCWSSGGSAGTVAHEPCPSYIYFHSSAEGELQQDSCGRKYMEYLQVHALRAKGVFESTSAQSYAEVNPGTITPYSVTFLVRSLWSLI